MPITNADGLNLIKNYEGLRLNAYLDSANIPTIGYGHTAGVRMGQQITNAQADQFLQSDIKWAEDAAAKSVQVVLNPNQFAALVAFVFNVGAGAFQSSTMLKKINAGDFAGAAEQFGAWVNAGGQKLEGLVRRREAERQLFVKPMPAVLKPGEKPPAPAPPPPPPLWPHVEVLAQQTQVSCGQTSVAMAINTLMGKHIDDLYINEHYGFALLDALNAECAGKYTWKDMGNIRPELWVGIEHGCRNGFPAVQFLNGPEFSVTGHGHIVLITKVVGEVVTFADPARGIFRDTTRTHMNLAPFHPDGNASFQATKNHK